MYPIRLVSPIQLPGAPPMKVSISSPIEVQPPTPVEHFFTIPTLSAGGDFSTPVIDSGESRTMRKAICAVHSPTPIFGCALGVLCSPDSLPMSTNFMKWFYAGLEGDGLQIGRTELTHGAGLFMTVQVVLNARYVVGYFYNGTSGTLSDVNMYLTLI